MIRTYVLDCSTLPDQPQYAAGLQEQMRRLPKERIEKIQRIRHADTRKQSLGAGLLLDYGLRRLAPDAQIYTNSYGKPVCAQVPFNLSHTKDAVILSIWSSADRGAFSFGQPDRVLESVSVLEEELDFSIGCDIEQIKPYAPGIARRFFTEAEYESLETLGDSQEQAELFFRYWTKKESVMKLTGLGLHLPIDFYDVQGSQVRIDRNKTAAWYEKTCKKGQQKPEYQQAVRIFMEKTLYFKEYRFKEYCITVCSFVNLFAPDISLVRFDGQRLYEEEKVTMSSL